MNAPTKLKKGQILKFKNRDEKEVIIKGSSNPVLGEIKTDKKVYSFDFLRRWIHFGIVEILENERKDKHS